MVASVFFCVSSVTLAFLWPYFLWCHGVIFCDILFYTFSLTYSPVRENVNQMQSSAYISLKKCFKFRQVYHNLTFDENYYFNDITNDTVSFKELCLLWSTVLPLYSTPWAEVINVLIIHGSPTLMAMLNRMIITYYHNYHLYGPPCNFVEKPYETKSLIK